jgi:Zn-dependent protease with chaperone function
MREALFFWGAMAFASPWSTVWPLLLLPVLALGLLRPALNRIETMWADPAWQTRAAALGACLPALVALCVTAGFSVHVFRSEPESLLCFVKFYGPASIAAVLLARALVLFQLRSRRLSRLIRLTRTPSARLARLAREAGVPVRELAADTPVCFASGVLRPCVVVSTGVLERLSDEDVRAALVHERAHLERGDNLRAVFVTILSDCAVLRPTKALRLYRRGREALADREAVRHVERTALAGALLSMTRMSVPNALAASFAGPDGLAQRIGLLLGSADARSVSHQAKRAVLVRMTIVAILGLYPIAAPMLHEIFCPHPGSALFQARANGGSRAGVE